MDRVKNKVAVVTGGARGIGRAICLKLASEGAVVNILDVNDSEETAESIRSIGGDAETYIADIRDSDRLEGIIRDIHAKWGRIDILVNNAGVVSTHENILTVTNEIWDREIGINLTAMFYCCRAVLGRMIEQKSGKIVNISSLAGDTGRLHTSPAYAAAKAGVYGLTMSMAKSAAKHGINVNAVCPGIMLTDITKAYPKEDLDKLLAEVPYPRGGRPEDIAETVLFLASQESDYINGTRIRVNGGSWMG